MLPVRLGRTLIATATKIAGVVAERSRAVNDFDADAVVAANAGDAYVSDGRREIRRTDAIRRWVNREMAGDNVTIEPVEAFDLHAAPIVRGGYGGTHEKSNLPGELDAINYISVRDGMIVSLTLIRDQSSESRQSAE